MKVGGVDLSVVRGSGVAVIQGDKLKSIIASTDDEIVNMLTGALVVAIDAPLSGLGKFRDLDKLMIKMGLRVMPTNWPWIRRLGERAIRIKTRLEEGGTKVIETHPRSVLKWVGLGLEQLSHALGVRELIINGGKDAWDAAVCALVALAYVKGAVRRVVANDGELYLIEKLQHT